MNIAYNQKPLDEQSRRLTQFVIGNQQYEFDRHFYGFSIGLAAFSAFKSKSLRPLVLSKKNYHISQIHQYHFFHNHQQKKMCKVLEKYHQVLLMKKI